jgi:hypothetical protein
MALLTYLTDPDPKIRRIAAFALEGVVDGYPDGMVSDDIQNVARMGTGRWCSGSSPGLSNCRGEPGRLWVTGGSAGLDSG